MRTSLALAGAALVACSTAARADDCDCGRPWTRLERFAMRTPCPRIPAEHSMQRAGYPMDVKPHAIPSVTRFDHGGYIGGGSPWRNDLLARGPGSALGVPQCVGVFGTDFGGFRAHLGRVFLAPSNDPSRGPSLQALYNADGPRVVDVFALRPLRKAVLEARADKEHKHGGSGHGGEGHGGNGHGAEGGHGPEKGGEKKGDH
jgi:hypothetical protein